MCTYVVAFTRSKQKKIFRVTGMLRTGDVDLNDVIENERHVHTPNMIAS